MFNVSQVNTLTYNPELCNGCRLCTIVCPHAVFTMINKKAHLDNPIACMECGACRLNCSEGAIAVESGVGCAAAMFKAALTGQKEATC
jgi:NAD-dependent dihydropyrimidine dehydrogenase PreA subunit